MLEQRYPLDVSIPYLRVTHRSKSSFTKSQKQVSIPYLRVTHQIFIRDYLSKMEFQSPIYGSRTQIVQALGVADQGFNPLSTGHALQPLKHQKLSKRVSIPYLRVTHHRL